MTMRYDVANMGEAEPPRYLPVGPADCTNAAEYRKALDNAAWRIAYYRDAVQQAAGNDQAVDRAAAGADLANRDWSSWSRVLKNCGETPVQPAAATPQGSAGSWAAIALLGLALVTVTVLVRPDLGSWFSKSKRR